jgi:lambda family phage portal protein
MPEVSIIDPSTGKPFQQPKARALANGGGAPFDAADVYGEHMAAWRPYLWSVDGERNMFRDRIVARIRDIERNDGWASGGITRIVDNVIGANFRPVAKPDYRALAAYSGNKAFDAVWADEFGRALETSWRTWADDPAKYCDAQRNLTVTQMMRLAFRHKIIDGDALAMLLWMPERIGKGRARYSTAVQLIDPDRLSNPQLRFDQQAMRGGVEVDEWGVAVGYWIRRAHQGDWFSAAESVHWDRVPRETAWGRPIIVHDFEHDRAGQHRGAGGVLTPVLQRLRMLVKYDATELDSAVINAIFGAYIESPFDHDLVQEAMGDDKTLPVYQEDRAAFHKEHRTMLGGARVPILFPGEKMNMLTATRPTSNFAAFEQAVLRNVSAALGLSAEQLSQDWSRTNYSSARAALLEAWKTLLRRRSDFSVGFASPIYSAFLEEAMEADYLPLPNGVVPDFLECRTGYAGVRWIGPGRGWVDPVKEKQAAILGIEGGLSTLESEAAEQGRYWEDDLEQRRIEIARYRAANVPLPSWARMSVSYEDKPEEEVGGAPA